MIECFKAVNIPGTLTLKVFENGIAHEKRRVGDLIL